jgi:hypothetical protein
MTVLSQYGGMRRAGENGALVEVISYGLDVQFRPSIF